MHWAPCPGAHTLRPVQPRVSAPSAPPRAHRSPQSAAHAASQTRPRSAWSTAAACPGRPGCRTRGRGCLPPPGEQQATGEGRTFKQDVQRIAPCTHPSSPLSCILLLQQGDCPARACSLPVAAQPPTWHFSWSALMNRRLAWSRVPDPNFMRGALLRVDSTVSPAAGGAGRPWRGRPCANRDCWTGRGLAEPQGGTSGVTLLKVQCTRRHALFRRKSSGNGAQRPQAPLRPAPHPSQA